MNNAMTPADQLATRKVVMAGKTIMYNAKTFPIFKQGMLKAMPMPQKLATEMVALMKLLQDKAKGAIPRQVLIPAASILMLEMAKFMDEAGFGQPTPQDIAAAAPILEQLMKRAFPFRPPIAPTAAPTQPPAPPGGGIIQSAQI